MDLGEFPIGRYLLLRKLGRVLRPLEEPVRGLDHAVLGVQADPII